MKGARFGQHFLTDLRVAAREIEYADIQSNEVILEIGPGHGVLTKMLAEQAAQVLAVEIDRQLVDELQRTMPENVMVYLGDVCKFDLNELPKFSKVVANLPFQISSEITFKLLTYPFEKAVLMYQKDFAERMVAKSGTKTYGRLSVGVFYKTHCRILERVPQSCFFPRPQVDACIVELVPRDSPPFMVADESFFSEVTKQLFMHRRKKIGTTVAASFKVKHGVPFAERRVEQLSPADIGVVADYLFEVLE